MRNFHAVLLFALLGVACSDTHTTIVYEPLSEAGTDDAGASDDEAGDNMARNFGTGPGGAHDVKNGFSASGNLITGTGGGINTIGLGGQGISCQKPWDAESDVYTVMFSVVPPLNSSGVQRSVIRPQALIKFSVGDGEVQRIIDVGQGTSISGPGQAVKAALYDAAKAGDPNVNAGIPYPVSISIARGTRASLTVPPTLWGGTFTLPDTASAPANAITINVPLLAGINSLLINYVSTDTTANIITVQELSGGVGTRLYAALPAGALFIPLLANTSQVLITNNSTTQNAVVTATWGVDG